MIIFGDSPESFKLNHWKHRINKYWNDGWVTLYYGINNFAKNNHCLDSLKRINTGCIKKLYTLGFAPISQLRMRFQHYFCTLSMCQTRAFAKNVQIFIPTTKSDQDIERIIKYVKKRRRLSSLFAIILFMVKWWEVIQRRHLVFKTW